MALERGIILSPISNYPKSMSQRHHNKKGFLSHIPAALVNSLAILGGLALIIFAFDLIFLFFPLKADESISARLGVFGDFFGGFLNPIVSIIGFMAVLYTINSQHADAEEQKQATALANNTQIKQQVEGTLFSLISLLEKTVKIENTSSTIAILLTTIYNTPKIDGCTLKKYYYDTIMNNKSTPLTLRANKEDASLIFLFLKITSNLHYIHNPSATNFDKNIYIQILLSKLSTHQLLATVLDGLDTSESDDPRYSKLPVNKELKIMITDLGLLRDFDFSPYNEKYKSHQFTIDLVKNYTEQAFRPIEAPPTNP